MSKVVVVEQIERKIYFLRGMKVMLDKDLASLYKVKAFRLREQVKRNQRRFPSDFMFQLNEPEIEFMVSQNAIPSRQYLGGVKPSVFTEQGVAMLSSVLKSELAISMNIAIMRAFVKLREVLLSHKELNYKLQELEAKVGDHDEEIKMIFEAIRQLMKDEEKSKREIGFHVR